MISQILDHPTRALRRIIQQYKNRQKFEALIRIIGERAQSLEDVGYTLFTEQELEFAVGAQLDRYGEIVVQPRNGFDDDFYRVLLRVKIGINISSGEPKAIINTIKILSQAALVHYQNLGDASILIGLDTEIDPALIGFIYDNMEKVVMAGVRLDAITFFDPDEPFSFDGVGPIGMGFSSLASPSTGGKFAYLQRNTGPLFAFGSAAGVADPSGAGFGSLADPLAGGLMIGL